MRVKDKLNLVKSYAVRYVAKVEQMSYETDGTPYLLESQEFEILRNEYRKTIAISVLLGTMGVLVLFIPKYLFPELFPRTLFYIPYIEYEFSYNVIFFVYGLILAYIELYLLYYYNLRSIRRIALVCRYPHKNSPRFKEEIELLAETGIEKNRKFGSELGLYPYQGVPALILLFYFAFNYTKAILSNHLMRLLVKRIGGRSVARVFIDMMGIPIFAFWDAWSTHMIQKEARIRIFSPPLIKQFASGIYHQHRDSESFKGILYDVLQYISIIKRKYNYSHYIFSKELLEKFRIPFRKKHRLPENFFDKWKELPEAERESVEKMVLFGIMVDGAVSAREWLLIRKLKDMELVQISIEELKAIHRSYRTGKGMGRLVQFY